MYPDRRKRPQLSELSLPSLLPYTKEHLSNGMELIVVSGGDQDIFKLDVVFEAGAIYQAQPLIASTTLHMLNEGTCHQTSSEIAEVFDYYGSYIDFNSGMHKSEASLLALGKYADHTVSLLGEMIKESIFPEKELEIYLRNKRQHFLTEKEKTSWLARKEFLRLLFGPGHPYANAVEEKDFESISREKLIEFYTKRIDARDARIVLSGHIEPSLKEKVIKVFSDLRRSSSDFPAPLFSFSPAKPGRYHVYKEGTVQTSIRIGKKGVSLLENDYAGFQLLNTVLGGYFGSRLMSNIREEKGFTYGIHSFNVTLPQSSYWGIMTDVNNRYTEAAIEEALKEIRKLQTELIPEEELSLVKNYFHGELLRELDGVFAQADSLKHKLMYRTDNRIYLDHIEKIKKYTSHELRELANQYLKIEDLYIVTAGSEKN